MNEVMNERDSGMDLNLQELLMAYLRKWRLIALTVVVAILVTVCFTAFCVTPTYRTGVTIHVNNNRVTEDKDAMTSADMSASIHLVKSYMIVSTSDPVLERAVAILGPGYTTGEIRSSISTEQVGETFIFALNVTHKDPQKAANIANTLAEVLPEEGPRIIDGTSARLVNTAKVPTTPYSPNYTQNVIMGAGVGLLLAVVYVTVMFLKDTRIKDENDLTVMFNLPILGRIPNLDGKLVGNSYHESTDKE